MSEHICGTCGKDATYGEIISAMSRKFHAACFVCASCQSTLEGGFYSCAERPFCAECIDDAEAALGTSAPPPSSAGGSAAPSGAPSGAPDSCARCRQALTGGVVISALEQKWHEKCFSCATCGCELEGFFGHNGQPYCSAHIDEAEDGGQAEPPAQDSSDWVREEQERRERLEREEREKRERARQERERQEREEREKREQTSSTPPPDVPTTTTTTTTSTTSTAPSSNDDEVARLKRRIAELETQLAAANARADAAEARASAAGAAGAAAAVPSGPAAPPPPPPPGPPPPPMTMDMLAPRKLNITRSGKSKALLDEKKANNPQADLLAEMAAKGRSRLRRVVARPSRREISNRSNAVFAPTTKGKVDPSLVKGADTGNSTAREMANNAEKTAAKAVDREERVKKGQLKKRHDPFAKLNQGLDAALSDF